jgi:hypothetical protein
MGAPVQRVASADEEAAAAVWWLRERYEGRREKFGENLLQPIVERLR